MEEKWLEIEGCPKYMVSNLGRVKSFRKNFDGIILNPSLNKDGYFVVGLYGKTYILHRLIAKAFIPNTENKPEVDHINGVKTDCRVENLRWATREENQNNPITKKRQSESMKGKKASEEAKKNMSKAQSKKPILQYDMYGNFIKKWESARQVEKELGIDETSIGLVCKGKYRHAGFYLWKYAS